MVLDELDWFAFAGSARVTLSAERNRGLHSNGSVAERRRSGERVRSRATIDVAGDRERGDALIGQQSNSHEGAAGPSAAGQDLDPLFRAEDVEMMIPLCLECETGEITKVIVTKADDLAGGAFLGLRFAA